jgi:hypothetical protein
MAIERAEEPQVREAFEAVSGMVDLLAAHGDTVSTDSLDRLRSFATRLYPLIIMILRCGLGRSAKHPLYTSLSPQIDERKAHTCADAY